jgi:hypothetical protein
MLSPVDALSCKTNQDEPESTVIFCLLAAQRGLLSSYPEISVRWSELP